MTRRTSRSCSSSLQRETRSAEFERLKANCNTGSTVFVYFSGHGGQIREGVNKGQYLLPVETVYPAEGDLARTAIPGTELTEALRAIQAKRLTVVLDCCHSGRIGEPREPASTEQFEIGFSERYLDELKSGTGRVIISTSRGTDPADVRDGANDRVFTGRFLEGLRGAARGDGGVIRILDLYSYVVEKVGADHPYPRPILKAGLEENYPIALYRGGEAQGKIRSNDVMMVSGTTSSSAIAARILTRRGCARLFIPASRPKGSAYASTRSTSGWASRSSPRWSER